MALRPTNFVFNLTGEITTVRPSTCLAKGQEVWERESEGSKPRALVMLAMARGEKSGA